MKFMTAREWKSGTPRPAGEGWWDYYLGPWFLAIYFDWGAPLVLTPAFDRNENGVGFAWLWLAIAFDAGRQSWYDDEED
jgi:hypothetical protein